MLSQFKMFKILKMKYILEMILKFNKILKCKTNKTLLEAILFKIKIIYQITKI